MIAATCFGTNDIAGAGAFYDKVLDTIGMVRLDANDNEVGYGIPGGEPTFWAIRPYDRQSATHGNGTQIIFGAPDADTVDRFYRAALENGGSDEGAPGLRDHTPGYYGAYCRDRDRNKLHIFAMVDTA